MVCKWYLDTAALKKQANNNKNPGPPEHNVPNLKGPMSEFLSGFQTRESCSYPEQNYGFSCRHYEFGAASLFLCLPDSPYVGF